MQDNRVFSQALIAQVVDELKITHLEKATIGQVVLIATRLEALTGVSFIRMDQGVPGLSPCRIGTEAEKRALDSDIPAIYPAAAGIPELRGAASGFIKAFLDLDISATGCIAVTGSVAGSFGSFIITTQCRPDRNKILFIDPGFPIQKSQLKVLGIEHEQFDIYHYRGELLREKVESYLRRGNIAAMIYSNPNNPAWICLTQQELKILGELSMQYDVTILEDLAYFGMDFRTNYGQPFAPPYVPTAARYTDNYILMLSASKIFSYAGQRTALLCVSDQLFSRSFEALAARYQGSGLFGQTLIGSIFYMITSGVTHSTQFGFAAMLEAATRGELDFIAETSEYARRAHHMKELFTNHGFRIVYDKDLDRPIADGFFFTIGYGELTSGELMRELLYYGISSIALSTTGSTQMGVRACCSRIKNELYETLEQRLIAFELDH